MTRTVVRTTGLTKRYGTHTAVDGVDLAVAQGSVFGLVGRNGAGKTTLLGLLAGLRRPTAGDLHVDAPRHSVALLPDTPQFDPWLTGTEVVSLARTLTAPQAPATRVEQALRDAGLEEAAGRRVGGYSRGMLQRLGLAATMVGEPAVLLLDEPASALDPAGRREVLDLIAALRGRATVVLSSHILSDVQHVCDTVAIMRAGRLLYQGPLETLLVGRAVPAYRLQLRAPADRAIAALRAADWVNGIDDDGKGTLRVTVQSLAQAEAQLAGVLAAAGARVISLAPAALDLEDVFLSLTSTVD